MKTNRIVILFSLLLAACQGAAPSADEVSPEPTQITALPVASDPAPSATALPPTATPDLTAACKLPVSAATGVALGFPRLADRLPSTGTVRATVLFVDFDDAPAGLSPQDALSYISPGAEEVFTQMSTGRLDLQLEPHLTWLRLSQPSSVYGESLTTYEGHRDFIQEAVDLADAEVDFSQTDLVIVLANPSAHRVPYGPTFTGFPGAGLYADGAEILNGITSGFDLPDWGHLWLNHEMGHSLGLPDLYAYNPESNAHRFVGGWSLMGWIHGRAPEYFAFERWMLGWLDDDQIVCHTDGEIAIELTALESEGGAKAVVVPLSATRALVVESRRALGQDATLIEVGALVYVVDTGIYSGEGTITVLPHPGNEPFKYDAPLAAGESLEYEGVTVTVLEAGDQSDLIQISIAP